MIGHLVMIARSLMIGIILAAILYSQHVFANEPAAPVAVNVAPLGANVDWLIGILQRMKAEGRSYVVIVTIKGQSARINRIAGLDTTELAHDTIGLVVIEGATR
jgi:hypothetical protein